jgi:hypothetical protein
VPKSSRFSVTIPRICHDPKVLGRDDAEVVGDRIAEVRPIARNLFAQETASRRRTTDKLRSFDRLCRRRKLVVDKQFLECESEIAFNGGHLDRSIAIESANYVRIQPHSEPFLLGQLFGFLALALRLFGTDVRDAVEPRRIDAGVFPGIDSMAMLMRSISQQQAMTATKSRIPVGGSGCGFSATKWIVALGGSGCGFRTTSLMRTPSGSG